MNWETSVFTDLRAQTQERLRSLCSQIAQVPSPDVTSWEFNTDVLTIDEEPVVVTSGMNALRKNGARYIYVLSTTLSNELLEPIRLRYSDAKTHKRFGRAYARLNEDASKVFYVGSSASIGRRIREHLGYGALGTYALHLAYWASDLAVPLKWSVACYPASVSENVIGTLEDQLWDLQKPMFGRRGRR